MIIKSKTISIREEPISFLPEYFDLLVSNQKSSTVRLGIRLYEPGPVIVTDGGKRQITHNVSRICITRLNQLTEKDAMRDGFNSLDELQSVLRKLYPNITQKSVVTVIYFDSENNVEE